MSDPPRVGYEVGWFWMEPNMGPLQEQYILLALELTYQFLLLAILVVCVCVFMPSVSSCHAEVRGGC